MDKGQFHTPAENKPGGFLTFSTDTDFEPISMVLASMNEVCPASVFSFLLATHDE